MTVSKDKVEAYMLIAGAAIGLYVAYRVYKTGASVSNAVSGVVTSVVNGVKDAAQSVSDGATMGRINSPIDQILNLEESDATGAFDQGTGMSQDTLNLLGLGNSKVQPSATALKNSLYAEQGVMNLI